MVRLKMEQKEYIILCLEDSNDWSNATTRRLVMQASTAAACAARGQGFRQRRRTGTMLWLERSAAVRCASPPLEHPHPPLV